MQPRAGSQHTQYVSSYAIPHPAVAEDHMATAAASYAICQAGCGTAWAACYAGLGYVAGTVTAGVGVPATIIACNTAQVRARRRQAIQGRSGAP